MRNDEQHFKPGDKVMRVAYADRIGLQPNGALVAETDFGLVLCVERCWRPANTDFNAVTFVGILADDDGALGWAACCFRRVDEVKLCVLAADRMREPVKANAQAEP